MGKGMPKTLGQQAKGRKVLDMVQLTDAYTVANAPSATGRTGAIIYVSNGAAGSPILAFSDGTNWLRSDTGAAIAVV